ncbi:MAG: molecular chaperone HtpG [Chromatiales bacterium]|jgi:molecular chaperone HtpG|nr:molecular chaperone HtpG [Chromatiales bacterium]
MTTTTPEKHGFQAEVRQLLHLMIHSLYSNREIFLRELVSNASDALDRLRFEAIAAPELQADDPELKIEVAFDPALRTITITDNGIGMTRDDVIRNLGTIARSGTGEFIGKLTGEQRKDANLIGQFGVGFYSAFMVADRVQVETRRAGAPAADGVRWTSDGQGEFTVEAVERPARGTTLTLHLKEDAAEFADEFRIQDLIRRYSDHIAFPVLLRKPAADGQEATTEAANAAKALWTRPKAEITDDEYREFYKHVAHDFQDPLAWSHNRVEGKREYTSLLYVPARAPWDLWNRAAPRGLKLYVRRVFILDEAEQFLPLYLRFIRGVVDSGDLSLNVSREMLQQDEVVESMRAALTKRVLDLLDRLAADDPEKYATFWKEFGRVIKEGPAEDPANRERIAKLLRFHSTHSAGDAADVSLPDYLARRKKGQDRLWYVVADSLTAARGSPHLELFRKQGIEVLLLTDPIDEWLIGQLREFDGVEFRDVRRGDFDPAKLGGEAAEKAPEPDPATAEALAPLKEILKDAVEDVRASARLTDSPACVVLGEYEMSEQMRRLMQATGQAVPKGKPILEVNLAHPLLKRIAATGDADARADLAWLLLEQAQLAEGAQLEDPARFVQRLNRILSAG